MAQKVSYEKCLFITKTAFEKIGGIKNAMYMSGAEIQLKKYQLKQKQKRKKSA